MNIFLNKKNFYLFILFYSSLAIFFALYVEYVLGYKAYMIDLTAAICLEQMKKLEGHLERRRHVQAMYNACLQEYIQPPVWSETVQNYSARVPAEHRDNLIDYLAGKKINTVPGKTNRARA